MHSAVVTVEKLYRGITFSNELIMGFVVLVCPTVLPMWLFVMRLKALRVRHAINKNGISESALPLVLSRTLTSKLTMDGIPCAPW